MPFCGPLPEKHIYRDGSIIRWADLMRPVVEGEIAFCMGTDLPARSTP
jgi:2-keto-4-pentenoate hydratase